jgi:Crinkler effector protein N-terminal domain
LHKEKEKKIFKNADADALVLCKVTIPISRSLKENLKNAEFIDKQPLLPVDHLSEIFLEPLLRRRFHIVVKTPPPGKYS